MTQLIIEGTVYPEAVGNDGEYTCEDEVLSEQETMISGRIIEEVRGTVKNITYSYKYFDNDLMRKCLNDLKVKRVVTVTYLQPDTDSMQTSQFLCTEIPNPTYYMSLDGTPYWTDIKFSLREVNPHD